MHCRTKKWCSLTGLTILASTFISFPSFAECKKNILQQECCQKSDEYKLEKVVMFSRHNIRSPHLGKSSLLSKLTNNKWFKWTAGSCELSLRGEILETLMGQYFRKYLISKGLIDENWNPSKDQIRFYANSLQRTIATSKYFSAGFLPVANVEIETHAPLDKSDSVFAPKLNYKLKGDPVSEVLTMFNKKKLSDIVDGLSENFKILEKVLDFKNSKYAKENNLTEFKKDNIEIKFDKNNTTFMKSSLRLPYSAADALILQYYEENDDEKAAFGEKLTNNDWKKIASIADVFLKILFGAPSVAKNVANPLLKELKNELILNGRVFSYLCGHDLNLIPILSSLDVAKYSLKDSIVQTIPIGSKFVIEKFSKPDGKEYAKLFLVYLSTSQIRNFTIMDLDNHPCKCELSLNGINKNKDGFYSFDDVIERFNQAINSYEQNENFKSVA